MALFFVVFFIFAAVAAVSSLFGQKAGMVTLVAGGLFMATKFGFTGICIFVFSIALAILYSDKKGKA